MEKFVYDFSEGTKDMKELLGGKGANLASMKNLGLPVPDGFIITTKACNKYYDDAETISVTLEEEIYKHLTSLEQRTGKILGDVNKPLLVSVRSGARSSMPGMMDTILNLGLNDEVAASFARITNNERFVYDSYRRLIMMFADVVMGKDKSIFEEYLTTYKKEHNYENDVELTGDDWYKITLKYKEMYQELTNEEFPMDTTRQLIMAVGAVFKSWNNSRAIYYRKINNIPDDWGTAVNIQEMVYGNKNNNSGTGVAFTRSPINGEAKIFGEYLINAQGEDVVAGIRTPQSIETLKNIMPLVYEEFISVAKKLEDYYKDMQDMEFTIEDGKLYMLQTRTGKRTGLASVNIATSLVREGKISKEEAIRRVSIDDITQALHKVFNADSLKTATIIGQGLAASPGAACGQIVFEAQDAIKKSKEGIKTVLVRHETSPEDIEGMHYAEGILTIRGGMTSHAAVVARGMGICCVSGCSNMDIANNTLITNKREVLHEGDIISIDGTTGNVYKGEIELENISSNTSINELLNMCNDIKNLGVRANADTKKDMEIAKSFGAEGIGLVRTEHMFFEKTRIFKFRQMILANDKKTRLQALVSLLPYQEKDFEELYRLNSGLPVVIRYLDPPLHEFLPKEDYEIEELAKALNTTPEALKLKIDSLKEFNPMMGHRGSRLDITYPEIAVMQTNAVISAACNVKKEGIDPIVEIMLPLIMDKKEFIYIKDIVEKEIKRVLEKKGMQINYQIGAMIEVPRAAILADELADVCDFFSFGTNDLTQLTFGFSRDDAAKFLKDYYAKNILEKDPFMSLDTNGVGTLVKIATKMSKSIKPNISLGVCGEHAADESSIIFFDKIGLSYISASAYRIPVAKLVAAKASLINKEQ